MDSHARIATLLQQALQQIDRLDAEALLCHLLQRERSYLRAWPEREIDAELNAQFQALVARRQQGEPLAYLIGWREFWSLKLNVTHATLIPRPDTELLVEQALARIPPAAQWQIADLGTGSGAIALAIASERPNCQLVATDFSAAALAVACGNAAQLGIPNIEFCHGSWCKALANNQYQMIVSNPPYIDGHDPHLQHDGLPFEPQSALTPANNDDGDGLAALRIIIDQARSHLAPPGWLLLEHGYNQGEMVRELLQQAGYHEAITLQDLGGQERLTLAQLSA
ncbi:MAG: peptide chain release factor N(5)-glutamine methyltransferase [Pseudomonadota bacterium]|nr:peptide chain release factor N(5)-glutamine methyltransferase [Pseudomonadota bacterium]